MNKNKRNTIVRVLVSLLLVIVAGVFLVRSGTISLTELGQAWRSFQLRPLFFAVAFALIQILFQCTRFWVLFPSKGLSWLIVAKSFCIGQAVNNFIPARVGDFVKIWFISRSEKNAPTFGLGTGVLLSDKIADIVALVSLALVSGALFLPETRLLKTPPLWMVWCLPFVLGTLFLLGRLAYRRGFSRIAQSVEHFKEGLTNLRKPEGIAAALMGMGCWVMEALTIQMLCEGQSMPITFQQAVFVICLLNLALSVPLTFANLGTFEASMVFALSRFGLSSNQALAIATAQHALGFLVIGFWGLCFWGIVHLWKLPLRAGRSSEIKAGNVGVSRQVR